MALVDTTWYLNFGNGTSTGYFAIALRPNAGVVAAGAIRRQFTAPAVGSERCFVCIVAGTTAAAVDATWVLTRGAKTVDGTATWMECTGQAALNGDLTNTATWAQVKAATPAVLGQIIKRSNNASYQICTTAGAMSVSEPAFSDTAGVTTTDTTAVWTSLGPVSNFTGGQAPFARLNSALTTNWFTSGNTIYVGDNHAETSSVTFNVFPTTLLMARVLCHNSSGPYPPTSLVTGATITSSAAANFTFAVIGSVYVYGIAFVSTAASANGMALNASPPSATGQCWSYFDNCSFALGSHTNAWLQVGALPSAAGNNVTVFNNCTVKFGHVGQTLSPSCCDFTWRNTGQVLAVGSLVPIEFIAPFNALSTTVLEALDLSQLTGSLYAPAGNSSLGSIIIKDCKLNASAAVTAPINTGLTVQFIRSDSAGTDYKSARYAYEGAETTETSIVRTGGAVDPNGQAQSRKIVTTADAQWLRPFKAEPYAIWNAVTGTNRVVTVYGTVNAGALPMNDDIWMEVEYLADSGSPLGDITTTTKASVLASNAAVSADSSVWVGTTPASGAPLDAVASVTGAWSLGRDMLTAFAGGTRYTKTGTAITVLNDQSGSGRNFTDGGLSARRPIETTAFPAGVLCADFSGGSTNVMLNAAALSSFITASSGAVVVSVIVDAVTSNGSTSYSNDAIIADESVYMGLYARNLSGVTFYAYNWDGTEDAPSTTGTVGPAYVLMWRHHGGNVYVNVNGGTEVSVASGNTQVLTGLLRLGGNNAGSACNCKIAEMFTTSDGSQTAALATAIAKMKSYVGVVDFTPFKLTTTLSSPQPQLPGYLHARIRAAKPSTTYYIDPQVILS